MNEVFLIGKIVSDVKFDFMVESKHFSVARFKIETLNKQIISIKAHDKLADFAYRKLGVGNMVFVYGELKKDFVLASRIRVI